MHPTTRRVLAAIEAHLAAHGYAPTVRELCSATNISSSSVIAYHLHQLRAQGLISFKDGLPRTIVRRGAARGGKRGRNE